MKMKKPDMYTESLIRNARRLEKPDFSFAILRLAVLVAAAAVIAGLGLWPKTWPVSAADLPEAGIGIAMFIVTIILVFSVRKADEWKRAVVLRFGKFRRIRGPGLFFLFPLVDRVAQTVDIRIRVSDFSTQMTLTGDSVPVDVEAVCFWLVWDPQKAVLEVEDYIQAVVLSSKTALRKAVSSHTLSTFLERGDIIQKTIQEEVDKKTTEWGITVLHIEITDIQIPEALQDSLSRVAQAEREKSARTLLAEAEIKIAKKLEEAVNIYSGNDLAMKLKILTILNEGLKSGNSMMLVPNSITEELKTKDVFGLQALSELRKASPAAKGKNVSQKR